MRRPYRVPPQHASSLYATIWVDNNNEVTQVPNSCKSSINVCGINSEEEEEEENVSQSWQEEMMPTWDANFVKSAWGKYLLA